MNQKKQRIAIAEHVGWQDVEFGVGPNSNLCLGDRPNRVNGKITSYTVDCGVPDYLNDLNAMHKVEQLVLLADLDDEGYSHLFHKYSTELHKLVNSRRMHPCYAAVSATAAQRAEAFLRTIGKWEDEA